MVVAWRSGAVMTDQRPVAAWQTIMAVGFVVLAVGIAVALVILAWGWM